MLTERWHFTVAWLVWIGLFFMIEGWAIWGKADHATLTNHIREWLRHQPSWILVSAWIFMIALTLHFLLDLKRAG